MGHDAYPSSIIAKASHPGYSRLETRQNVNCSATSERDSYYMCAELYYLFLFSFYLLILLLEFFFSSSVYYSSSSLYRCVHSFYSNKKKGIKKISSWLDESQRILHALLLLHFQHSSVRIFTSVTTNFLLHLSLLFL